MFVAWTVSAPPCSILRMSPVTVPVRLGAAGRTAGRRDSDGGLAASDPAAEAARDGRAGADGAAFDVAPLVAAADPRRRLVVAFGVTLAAASAAASRAAAASARARSSTFGSVDS